MSFVPRNAIEVSVMWTGLRINSIIGQTANTLDQKTHRAYTHTFYFIPNIWEVCGSTVKPSGYMH